MNSPKRSGGRRRTKVEAEANSPNMAPVIAILFSSLISSRTASASNATTTVIVRKTGQNPIFEYSPWEVLAEVSQEWRMVLRFTLDFGIRYEWDHIVLFVPVSSVLLKFHAAAIYEYFNSYGKYISLHSTSQSLLPQSLYHNRHRVGVVLVWEPGMDDFFQELAGLDTFNEYRTWLFIRREVFKGMNMTRKLSELNLGIETNAVIGRVERSLAQTKGTSRTSSTTTEDYEFRYFEVGEKVCVPENQKEAWYRGICVTGEDLPPRIKREAADESPAVITLHQAYKIPGQENGSFIQIDLGFWDRANGFLNSEAMVPVEKRLGSHNFRVVIGVRNSTFEGGLFPSSSFSLESDEDEEVHMKEVLECLLFDFNATREVIQYPKIGWRNEEGGWTHMLGAVVEGAVDFALDTIGVNMDQMQEMSLTYPIVRTMNNIYFRRPDSGGMRDIFLAPFSTFLLVSVFGTAVLLSLAMISIAVFHYKISREVQFARAGKAAKMENDDRKWEVSEAALWSVSVMCMQGSSWRPNSKSGSLLLICGLLFALIIYNAYAAFITSVLSVKNVRIKNLVDLIQSNFAFGYTLGNTDELFLRTVNNSLLRELYFKGLKENDGVKDPITGMHRAGEGEYAFFVAARTARRALVREVAHSRRCGIQELSLPETRTVAAIPMSKRSPFKKIINFRVLRMMESGILHRFQTLILPQMPKCVEKNTFNSARFTDVYSAFYLVVSGWIASLVVLVGEILWHRRSRRGKRSDRKTSPARKIFHAHDFHWPRRMHN